MSWKWKILFQQGGCNANQRQDGDNGWHCCDKVEDIDFSCNGNVGKKKREWSSRMIGLALRGRCLIDVSIEQERRAWRLGVPSLDCCKVDFWTSRMTESSQLLFVDSHSDGSHDL